MVSVLNVLSIPKSGAGFIVLVSTKNLLVVPGATTLVESLVMKDFRIERGEQ